MFMLIIWLQGIWLPEHGYSFTQTPLWAGIYMLPLTAGFLLAGPASGFLSDRFGARPFATGGMIGAAASFLLLLALPVDFNYGVFAAILLFNGLSMGAFAAPNRAGVMNSLPAAYRGAGGGMNSTFQNSAQVLSIGIFFTLMIVGLSSTLSGALTHGLVAHGVGVQTASRVGTPSSGVDPLRRLPRLQPGAVARRPRRPGRALARQPGGTHRPLVLPEPDLQAVPRGAHRGVPLCRHRLPGRRRRVVVTGRALCRRRRPGGVSGHPVG